MTVSPPFPLLDEIAALHSGGMDRDEAQSRVRVAQSWVGWYQLTI